MTAPFILAFCIPSDRNRVRDSSGPCPVAYWGDTLGTTRDVILLAIGPGGTSSLCEHITAHGLDGVSAIVCVGATAPWAERRCERGCEPSICYYAADAPLPLGPLAPLRAVAERAREAIPLCEQWCYGRGEGCNGEPCGNEATHVRNSALASDPRELCGEHAAEWVADIITALPVRTRLILACTPDDGVCKTCVGRGRQGSAWDVEGSYDCDACDGTGKALSSANVALELSGERALMAGIDDCESRTGGLTTLLYPTKEALDMYGLKRALEIALIP